MIKLLTGALLVMASCASLPPAEAKVPIDDRMDRRCDAAKARGLIGRARSAAVGAKALRLSGARTLRWIPRGGVMTMDYREDRLNLHLDRRFRVARIDCG